jgi:hypothetical protein
MGEEERTQASRRPRPTRQRQEKGRSLARGLDGRICGDVPVGQGLGTARTFRPNRNRQTERILSWWIGERPRVSSIDAARDHRESEGIE